MIKSKFGVRMDSALDKEEIIRIVKTSNRKNVLDLGAGTCNIGIQLSKDGIKTTSVDNDFKAIGLPENNLHKIVNNDIKAFLLNYKNTEKFDCIILSAILHELPCDIFAELPNLINKVIDRKGIIIIREPYYDKRDQKLDKRLRPNYAKAIIEINNKVPSVFQRSYMEKYKKHEVDSAGHYIGKYIPFWIKNLNMAFAYSYGKDAWSRESHEGRYVFSKKEIKDFCRKCFIKRPKIRFKTYKNLDYYKYFRECGFEDIVMDNVKYTNCMIIVEGR